jgi:hypothetical protein
MVNNILTTNIGMDIKEPAVEELKAGLRGKLIQPGGAQLSYFFPQRQLLDLGCANRPISLVQSYGYLLT